MPAGSLAHLALVVVSILGDGFRDEAACTTRAAVSAALALAPPATTTPGELRLDVTLRAEAERIVIELSLATPEGAPFFHRALVALRADCPEVPRLLAHIVGRELEGLPEQVWARAAAPNRPPLPWSARATAEAGLAVGVGPTAPQLLFAGKLDLGPHALRLVGLGSAAVGMLESVGQGAARRISLGLGVGVAYDLRLASLNVAPELSLLGGVQVARGEQFARSDTATLPLFAIRSGVTLYWPHGLVTSVGLHLPLLRARLREQGTTATRAEPSMDFVVLFGFSRALSIY